MKRLFTVVLTAILLFFGSNAFAQLSLGEGRWSAGGGATFFGLAGSDAEVLEKFGFPNSIPGFYFGVNLDYAFSTIDGLSVEPGVYVMHYGKPFKFGLGDDRKSYHANYLSVPIHLKYAIPTGGDFGLALFTGPRFNVGIGGNMLSSGKTYPGLMPVDAQWGFGIAATIQEAVVIQAGYDTGLTKAIKDNKDLSYADIIAHRDTYHVGVCFVF